MNTLFHRQKTAHKKRTGRIKVVSELFCTVHNRTWHIDSPTTKQRVHVKNDALKEEVREMAVMFLQLLTVAVQSISLALEAAHPLLSPVIGLLTMV